MTDAPAITIPRLDNETPKAYAARVEYVTAGPGRSLDKLRQSYGKTTAHYTRQLENWSSAYNWQEHAKRYDDALAQFHIQLNVEQYRKDLEDHRARYQKAGKDLFTVAQGFMAVLAQSLRGQTIEGKDGKRYVIPAMEMTPGALTIAARALATAADLEAHALRIADLMPKLDVYDSE
jgi:hypothetical protein